MDILNKFKWIILGFLFLLLFVALYLLYFDSSIEVATNVLESQIQTLAAPDANSSYEQNEVIEESATQSDEVVEEIPAASKVRNGVSDQYYLHIAVIILSLVVLFSVAISFYLYKWRRILLENPQLLLPEEIGKHIKSLTEAINHNTGIMDSNHKSLRQETLGFGKNVHELSENTSSKIDDIADMFLTLHKSLDDKDVEIKKLKNGYDKEIFKKFIFRFIRVDQAVCDLLNEDNGDSESLTLIRNLLENALSECDVEIFNPEIGVDYKKEFGVADNPKTVQSDKEEDEFKILEVIEEGYFINTPNGKEVIVPAKVKVFGAYTKE